MTWQKNLPMWLTMGRIFSVPLVVGFMAPQTFVYNLIAAAIFTIASITDYYDGYFARKYNAVSNMGKFMDPIADKILVSSVLILLVTKNLVDPYMVILIIARDTYISGIRSVAAADNIIISAKPTGKWKTGVQMVAIPALMIGDLWGIPVAKIAYFSLWVAVLLSVFSGAEYYLAYLKAKKN